MTNKKPEALELAEDLESGVVPAFYKQAAAALLRRQHQRIEELESALRACWDLGIDSHLVPHVRTLLSTNQQED